MENTVVPKGNAWTTFVRDWAGKNNTTYMVAIKDPVVSQAYKDSKKQKKKLVIVDNFEKLKGDAVAMAEAIDPPAEKKKAGRPSKYANDEERKEAKRLKTLASNKKKREEMSKKNKEGTMTALEKSNWEHDTELNVARTNKMRDRIRGEGIAKYELVFNKLRSYIIDNEKEYFENFNKDPYEIRWGEHDSWKPEGKYQERAVKLFGKNPPSENGIGIDLIALTSAEYVLFHNQEHYIPNWDWGMRESREEIKELKKKLQSKVYDAQRKGLVKRAKEAKGMMEDDPYEKRKIEEAKKAAEKERKEREDLQAARQAARDKAEKERRAALTPAQRAYEDAAVQAMYSRFVGRGRGAVRGGATGKGGNWVSLVERGFWN